MSYFLKDFKYASGYFSIRPDGTYWLASDTPQDIKERFEKEWPEYVKKIQKQHEEGIYLSSDLI